jgi:hypothetical protein
MEGSGFGGETVHILASRAQLPPNQEVNYGNSKRALTLCDFDVGL